MDPVDVVTVELPVVTFCFTWKNKEESVKLTHDQTIASLKERIYSVTNILPVNQKLLGLKSAQGPAKDDALVALFISSKTKFMLMGTPQDQIPDEPSDRPIVFDDLDFDYVPTTEELDNVEDRQRKLKQAIATSEIRLMNPLRQHKKLLVLDLDHTLFHFSARDKVQHITHVARPGLEFFLASAFMHYNLAIWSQTSWRWLEIKLTELGLLSNASFQISFVLDKEAMFKVKSYRKEKAKVLEHEVKPLQLIWTLLPQYNHTNTLHIDDLGRNFAMNPKNGIRVEAFYLNETSQSDRELFLLAKYLAKIAVLPDVTAVPHDRWRYTVDE